MLMCKLRGVELRLNRAGRASVDVEFIIQQELNFDGTSSHLERIT
jgi:hypothetical protein